MTSQGISARIGKVLVECQYDCLFLLSPTINNFIGLALKAEILGMPNYPRSLPYRRRCAPLARLRHRTLMQAGRPEAKARSRAGRIASGFSTASP